MYRYVINVTNATSECITFPVWKFIEQKRDVLPEMRLNETLTSVVKLQFTKIRRINV